LAEAQANSIQQAEMAAAAVALEKRQDLVNYSGKNYLNF
jgi:hypothetical protein